MQNNVIIERICCKDKVNAMWMDMGFICIFAFAKQSDALQLLVQIKQTLHPFNASKCIYLDNNCWDNMRCQSGARCERVDGNEMN